MESLNTFKLKNTHSLYTTKVLFVILNKKAKKRGCAHCTHLWHPANRGMNYFFPNLFKMFIFKVRC